MPSPDSFQDTSLQDCTQPGPSHNEPAPSTSRISEDVLTPPDFITCVDHSSAFFRILTAPFTPSQPSEPCQSPSCDPSTSEYLPFEDTRAGCPLDDEESHTGSPPDDDVPPVDHPPGYLPSVLSKSIYTPHGKWEWAAEKPFEDVVEAASLHSGKASSITFNQASIAARKVQYICHSYPKDSTSFLCDLALYKCQLKPLQGNIVPSVIGVSTSAAKFKIATEPPHPVFWIEASPDMPHVLKQRCVEAFQKLHDRGVLHGRAELRHMLVGGDARVTIVGFRASKALESNETLGVLKATPEELSAEMDSVKRRINYADPATSEQASDSPPPYSFITISSSSPPRRFVMPGTTSTQLYDALRRFFHIVDGLMKTHPSSDDRTHNTPPPPPSAEADGIPSSQTTEDENSHPHYFLRDRAPRTLLSRKRKDAPTHSTLSSASQKRPRRGKRPQPLYEKPITRPLRPIECSKPRLPPSSLVIPHLPLNPSPPSPATPSPDPLLLVSGAAMPPLPHVPPRSPEPLSPVGRPWVDDPYGRSRGHNNYSQLVALAVKRGVPRFRPGHCRSSISDTRPPLPQLSVDIENLNGELPSSSDNNIGKRKRGDDSDALADTQPRKVPKVLKWSDGALPSSSASSSTQIGRSILKKHNPPSIRSLEMSRIAELSDDEEEPDLLASHGILTIEEVDRINDGSRELDEELEDDLDMLIDAQDSDDNFLSGHPVPLASIDEDIGSECQDRTLSEAPVDASGVSDVEHPLHLDIHKSDSLSAQSTLASNSSPDAGVALPCDDPKVPLDGPSKMGISPGEHEGSVNFDPDSPQLSTKHPPFTRSLKGLLVNLFGLHE
ncbi:hypothetical protein ONZ45_g2325 [Pleurotus djamor]|nr:hypothetical protein ONZ45_g2325 [Pleurotus djamor]